MPDESLISVRPGAKIKITVESGASRICEVVGNGKNGQVIEFTDGGSLKHKRNGEWEYWGKALGSLKFSITNRIRDPVTTAKKGEIIQITAGKISKQQARLVNKRVTSEGTVLQLSDGSSLHCLPTGTSIYSGKVPGPIKIKIM